MKKLLSMKTVLIAIAFTVFLLLIKDNLDVVWNICSMILAILTPFFIGFLIAYILNFPYKFFYTKAFGKMGQKRKILAKLKKPFSLICTYLIVLALIVMIIEIVVPQIALNITNLVDNMPTYFNNAMEYVNQLFNWINSTFNTNFSLDSILNSLYKELTQLLTFSNITSTAGDATSAIFTVISSTTSGLYNFIMGIVISIYFLAEKEMLCRQCKRLAVAFIPIKRLPKIYEIVDITDTKCGRFLVGDILDAGLVGILVFITMSIFQLPYAALIGVLIGVTNIIPFFGPYIGGIPSAFILLLVSPRDMIIFIIILVIIQQLDGNLFKPKIIGNQLGLSSFWVLFSVVVGGALFGVIGFVLGSPIYAVIYTLIGKRVRNKINDKGKIAQQALDFEVLNYAKIAEEQKKIREEKERLQKEKFMKFIHLDKFGDENESKNTEDSKDTVDTEDKENTEESSVKSTENQSDEEKESDNLNEN